MNASPTKWDNKTLFKAIYQKNAWLNENTRSGNGSDLEETPIIRMKIPELLQKYEVQTMFDAGCGEFYWQKEMDLSFVTFYMGVDIVPAIIDHNKEKYAQDGRIFKVMDITTDQIPCVDIIICRDVFQHFSDNDIMRAVSNMKRSGSKYLLTSTFKQKRINEDPIKLADALQWRVTGKGRNLQLHPFTFPTPLETIAEGWQNKTLGLWKIADLPDYDVQNPEDKLERLNLLEE